VIQELKMSRRRSQPFAVALCGICFSLFLLADASGYRLLKKIPVVNSEGTWDFASIDESARRLYVAHETQVDVLDVDKEAVVGKISGAQGAHGIAIAPELGVGFITNGDGAFVTDFDLRSLRVTKKIPTGNLPDAIVYEPATRRVLSFNTVGRNATVIDASTGNVVETIPLDGKPEFAVSDYAGHVFVDLVDKAIVARLDAEKLKVSDRWQVEGCDRPTSMAMDRKNHRLFVGCRNFLLAVLSSDDGKKITTLPIGDNVDTTAFDPETGLIFSSTEDGIITVMHEDGPDSFRVVDTVKTQNGSKTMALDLKTHHLFVPSGEVSKLPPATPGGKVRKKVAEKTFAILVLGREE
jgi:DNA-binding beta-propeller fold protein YncE